MTTAAVVADVLAGLTPFDPQEQRDRDSAVGWLRSTDDVFRRVPPCTPPQHLVSYAVLRDPGDGAVLLVDHRRSGLWLPAGGHVEPGEDPAAAARREAAEELGVTPRLVDPSGAPAFLTITRTVGPVAARHTDVSLWFVLAGSRTDELVPNPEEIVAVRWWRRADVLADDPHRFDPQLGRFLAKLDHESRKPNA